MAHQAKTRWFAPLYVTTVIAVGVMSIGWALSEVPWSEWNNLIILIALVGTTSLFPIVVKSREHFFVVTTGLVQAAMLIWGGGVGIIAAAVGGLASSFNRSESGQTRPISYYKMAFNVGSFAIAALVHAELLSMFQRLADGGAWWMLGGVYLLAPFMGNLVNGLLVALAINLHAGAPMLMLMRSSAWVYPYWVVLWAIGAVMAHNFHSTGVFGIVVFLMPLFLVRYAYKLYVDKSKEAEAYVNDLQASNAKLADTVDLLSVLHSGSVMLTGNVDPAQVPAKVRDLVVEALSSSRGALFGCLNDQLRCLGSWRDGRDCPPSTMSELSEALTADPRQGVRHVTLAGEDWNVLPLTVNNDLVGLLCIDGNSAKFKGYAEVLETFAAQVAVALATSHLYEETRRAAFTDGMTGLANQRSMRDQLSRLMEKALEEGSPLSLVTLDLDKFKQINDRFGHPTGDRAIKEVAQILQRHLGPHDVAARNGGDEFALILPGRNPEQARELMQKIADSVSQAVLTHGKQRVPLSLSVGIAEFPEHANTLPTLISRSDQAVYISKHTGRNRVTVWGDLSSVEDQSGQPLSWALDDRRDSAALPVDPIRVMTAMIDVKDGFTHGHSMRVDRYCAAVAVAMGLSEAEQASIALGGLLHDVGKLATPDSILNKPGPLTDAEMEVMRQHPEMGAELMRRIGMPEELVLMVLHHQEWWDGRGYPAGLSGKDIPVGARIIAVCDAFEAITSRRPYKQPKPIPWALEELRRFAGTQFDPEIVQVFIQKVLGQEALNQVAASVTTTRN